MGTNIVNAGIAWGVPVRPDVLGEHLEAYEESLQTLIAIRLCHRFGRGSNVHITRLPMELLTMIEDHISEQARSGNPGQWRERYRHFEDRCEPAEHTDLDLEIHGGIIDDCFEELCDSCQEDLFDSSCKNECQAIIRERTNKFVMESGDDWYYEECEEQQFQWKMMISQEPEGKFVNSAKLLRRHFGLEAHFAITRKPVRGRSAWPDHPNYKWRSPPEVLQTTACFLTLPAKMAQEQEFGISEMEGECGDALVRGARSSFVELPELYDKRKRSKQFQRALRILDLQPYVYGSQLNETITAHASNKVEAGSGHADKEVDLDLKKKDIKQMKWPRLMMLVNTQFEW